MESTSDYHQSSRLDLACEPSAARWARAHARNLLPAWRVPEDVIGDAQTVISELVTNAVRHAAGTGSCALHLRITHQQLVISVSDADPRPPARRAATQGEESGRGLELVASLCEEQWGFAHLPGVPGKTVWARLRLPSPRPCPGNRKAPRWTSVIDRRS